MQSKYFALIAVSLLGRFASAQDWKTADSTEVLALMRNVSDAYRANNFVLSYNKLFYLNEGDTIFTKDSGRLIKGSGNSYYAAGSEDFVVQDEHIKLIVSDSANTIYLSDPDTVFNVVPVSGLAQTISNYTFQQKKEGNKILLKVVPKIDPNIESMQLEIESGKFISQLRIDYNPGNYILRTMNDQSIEKPLLIMTYTAPEPLGTTDRFLLDPARFATTTGNVTRGNNHYKDYTITDLRNPATTKIKGK